MEEYEVVTIPVSDGTEKEFAIIKTFEVDNEQYMAVSLIEDDVIQEGVYIYKWMQAEEEEVIIEKIMRPAEYKKVVKAYEKLA